MKLTADTFELLIEPFDDIVISVSDNNIIKGVQHSNQSISNIDLNNIIGKNYKIYFSDNLNDIVDSMRSKGMLSGLIQKHDYHFSGNGKDIWYSIVLCPSINHENHFSIIFRNVTSPKTVEASYKRIFDNAVMGIYQSTLGEGRHISVNPALAQIYGYDSTEDLLGNVDNIANQLFVVPERRKQLMQTLKEKGECKSFESQIFKKDKSIVWISENAKAINGADGKIKYIVGTVKDITERKITEHRLREAKDDWERTFNSLDDIIAILDLDMRVVRLNSTAKNNIEYSSRNKKSLYCSDILRCDSTDCGSCPASKTVLDQKSYTVEMENITLGKTFNISTSPKYDEQNKLLGIVLIAQDITEEKKLRKEAEYRLQQAIQADKLKSLGEMVANVAHEINNPNSFIVYNISLIEDTWKTFLPLIQKSLSEKNGDKKEYYELLDEMYEIIASIKNGSQRIENVVSELKDFAKSNIGGKMVPIKINNVIEKTISIIGKKIKSEVDKIEIIYGKNIPKINAHLQRLEQVLINLIMNSLQAVHNKEKSLLAIESSFNKRTNSIIISVFDNGIGIKEENISKLFEPFFTTRRDIGGTGLGLSISYEIINQHKGKIFVHSKKGVGTKFTIILPVSDEFKMDLNPRILCVDNSREIFNALSVSFLNDFDKFVSVISEPAEIKNYIFDHPEIDVLLVNEKYGKILKNILASVKQKNPLIEIILYSEKEIKLNKEENSEIVDHYISDFNVNKLKPLLNNIVRQKL